MRMQGYADKAFRRRLLVNPVRFCILRSLCSSHGCCCFASSFVIWRTGLPNCRKSFWGNCERDLKIPMSESLKIENATLWLVDWFLSLYQEERCRIHVPPKLKNPPAPTRCRMRLLVGVGGDNYKKGGREGGGRGKERKGKREEREKEEEERWRRTWTKYFALYHSY